MKGQPTLFNSKEVKTRPCPTLSQARLASTSPNQLEAEWIKLREACDFMVWGGDCYSYGLLTLGGLDSVIETQLSTYDYIAMPPIIAGAGGHMCDWEGKALDIHSDGRTLAVGDITLKDQVLDILK